MKKRLISWVLVLTIILPHMVVLSGTVAAATTGDVLFAENFERGTHKFKTFVQYGVPGSYGVTAENGSNRCLRITTTPETYGKPGEHYGRTWIATNDQFGGDYTCEARIKTNGSGYVAFRLPAIRKEEEDGRSYMYEMRFEPSGQVRAVHADSSAVTMEYSEDTWYIIRIEVEESTGSIYTEIMNNYGNSLYSRADSFSSFGTGPVTIDQLSPNSLKNTCVSMIDDIVVTDGEPVRSVTLNQDWMRMKVGETQRLVATCRSDKVMIRQLDWSTSNSAVASVDANGVVTARGLGVAYITVKASNGKCAVAKVEVKSMAELFNGTYDYEFPNHGSYFGYKEGYSIPPERGKQAGLSDTKAKKVSELKWNGNCFGMSSSSILFFKGDLSEETYMKNDIGIVAKYPYPYYLYPYNNEKLRHMIEVLQVAQHRTGYRSAKFNEKNIDKVKNELDKNNPVMLELTGIEGTKGLHEIVVTGYTEMGGSCEFSVYDCSGFVATVNNHNGKWVCEPTPGAEDFWAPNVFYTYDEIKDEVSNIRNKNVGGAGSLFSLRNSEPTYTYIFTAAQDFIIKNSAGQVWKIVDGELLEEVENVRLIESGYLAEEQTYTIILPTDEYTITGSGDDVMETSFVNDYMFAAVTAKADTPITVSADLNTVQVDTAEGDNYNVQYTTFDNLFDEMNLSGTASGVVTTTLKETEVVVTGADTLVASASVSERFACASAEKLAGSGEVIVKCEEADGSATLQIVAEEIQVSEKVLLPQRETVTAPTYNLDSGTYMQGQTLALTADEEVVIYYTTDGSIPSRDNGAIYSLPININKSMTINAISTQYGYADSEVVELTYTLPEVAPPQANIQSGEYDQVFTVELFTGDHGDMIYYTLDGSDPFVDGILYTVPLVISKDTLLRAYTLKDGCVSEVSQYEYAIATRYPFHFVNALTDQGGAILTADKLPDLAEVNLVVEKLHTGAQMGFFEVAFYDGAGELICTKTKEATISEDMGFVTIQIDEDVSYAHKITASVWADSEHTERSCEAHEERIDAYDVLLGEAENGTIEFDRIRGEEGDVVTVTAKPDEGFELYSITLNGEKIEGNTFRMVIGDNVVSAVFLPTGTITDCTRTLTLGGEILITNYAIFEGFEGIDIAEKGGLLVWKTPVDEANATYETADDINAGLPKSAYGGRGQNTDGIPSKEYGDELYMRVYVELSNGTYAYGPLTKYSVKTYCENQLGKPLGGAITENLKAVCAEILHYGAAAQKQFNHNTDELANANIKDTYPPRAWDANLLTELGSYTTNIVADGTVTNRARSLSLSGVIYVNYYFQYAGEYTEAKLLYWSGVDGELTEENARITDLAYKSNTYGGSFLGTSADIVAKDMGKTVFACARFKDAEGNYHYSNMEVYSPETYADNQINRYEGTGQQANLVELCKRMVIYGEAARQQFGG